MGGQQSVPAPLLEAKVAKAQAEAAAATALKVKLKAEAAAATQRAASEEALQAKLKAELNAEQAAAFRKEIAWWSIAAVGVSVTAALALDFCRHESPAHIKRSMRRMLLSFASPEANALRPVATLIKVPQVPLVERLASKPTVLVGESGCGKSTLLHNTACELVSRVDAAGKPKEPTPTCLVSIRLNASRDKVGTPTDDAEAANVFSQTAATILRQIGAPTRRALIYKFVPSGFLPVNLGPMGERVEQMLELFLETAAEISKERLACKLPPKEAVTVLLWDEMHDLVKDSRYAKAGGKRVFDFLARQLVDYGTKKGLVRSVLTGSTAELLFKLEGTSVASGERVETYALQDPPEEAVQAALVKVGYTEADAARIVRGLGARMRFLEAPLREFHLVPADELIRRREITASRQYEDLFSALSRLQDGAIARAAVANLLDRVEAAQAAAEASASTASAGFPRWKEVPDAAISVDLLRVAFIDLEGRLLFQSRVHRRVWRVFRESVFAAAGTESSTGSRPCSAVIPAALLVGSCM